MNTSKTVVIHMKTGGLKMSRRIMRTVLGAAAALTMTTVVGFPAMAEGKTITFMCWYDEDDVASVIDALNEELGGEYEVEYSYVAQ
jgi:ABC-type glycerol-3-phosphate transport system substrate-binding protein